MSIPYFNFKEFGRFVTRHFSKFPGEDFRMDLSDQNFYYLGKYKISMIEIKQINSIGDDRDKYIMNLVFLPQEVPEFTFSSILFESDQCVNVFVSEASRISILLKLFELRQYDFIQANFFTDENSNSVKCHVCKSDFYPSKLRDEGCPHKICINCRKASGPVCQICYHPWLHKIKYTDK
jgi:hypothetical protein